MSAGSLEYSPWRFYLAGSVVLLSVVLLSIRMVNLTFFMRPFLLREADARAVRLQGEPAFRGIITDRNGFPLAVSAQVASFWVDPAEFKATPIQIRQLTDLLGLKQSLFDKRISKSHGRFLWLRRGLSPTLWPAVKDLGISGLYLQHEYRRFYPEGELTAHVVGFTGVDEHGQEGLERVYDSWLAGQAGQRKVIRDRTGRVVQDITRINPERPGQDLTLSLDRRIQYLAARELEAGVRQNQAVSGSVVVLDVITGEVLAMVNQPVYNPNRIEAGQQDRFRNRAVTDSFEPGSTIKTFSVASALESGRFRPDSLVNTWPGWLRVGGHLVRDEHNNRELSLTQILQVSSNVGMSRVILSLPPAELPHLLQRVGFGQVTASGFPGEQPGRLPERAVWKPFPLATLSFGYGISVTTLQLAKAYAVLANHGIRTPVSLLKLDQPPQGKRVLDAKIADQMLHMLQSVLEKGGTGQAAKVEGYQVAGKTGTAWVAGRHGYEKHRYTSSFVGIAPASRPRLVVAVVIHEPKGKQYFGGQVSGPVFEKVMQGALRILNVPQDARKDVTMPNFSK